MRYDRYLTLAQWVCFLLFALLYLVLVIFTPVELFSFGLSCRPWGTMLVAVWFRDMIFKGVVSLLFTEILPHAIAWSMWWPPARTSTITLRVCTRCTLYYTRFPCFLVFAPPSPPQMPDKTAFVFRRITKEYRLLLIPLAIYVGVVVDLVYSTYVPGKYHNNVGETYTAFLLTTAESRQTVCNRAKASVGVKRLVA